MDPLGLGDLFVPSLQPAPLDVPALGSAMAMAQGAEGRVKVRREELTSGKKLSEKMLALEGAVSPVCSWLSCMRVS